MTQADIQVFDTEDQLQQAAAEQIANLLQRTTSQGETRVALAGGSTPRRLYELLSEIKNINWSRVHVYWSDERAVPPDHEECNYRMAYEVLLERVSIPDEQIHRMRGEVPPEDAARQYERVLRETFELEPGQLPQFDLILLGMGADGHTASLFPGTSAVHERERLVVANDDPDLSIPRITLTFPVLNAAAKVMFLVAGQDKAPAVRQVIAGSDGDQPPAAHVRPTNGNLRWLLDREAAKDLK